MKVDEIEKAAGILLESFCGLHPHMNVVVVMAPKTNGSAGISCSCSAEDAMTMLSQALLGMQDSGIRVEGVEFERHELQ